MEKTMTVRDLIRELNEVSNVCEEYDLVLWAPGDLVCCVTKTIIDEDGDVRICVEEEYDDGGYYTVEMLRDELESYDEGKSVYWAGCGLYMTVEQDGGVFAVDHDSESVGADALVVGRYEEEEEESGWLTIEDRRELAEANRKQRRQNRWMLALLGLFSILTVYILCINVYEAVTRTGDCLGSNIVWILVCPVILVVEVMTMINERKGL